VAKSVTQDTANRSNDDMYTLRLPTKLKKEWLRLQDRHGGRAADFVQTLLKLYTSSTALPSEEINREDAAFYEKFVRLQQSMQADLWERLSGKKGEVTFVSKKMVSKNATPKPSPKAPGAARPKKPK
jgi:hypothetical protein